MSRILVWSPNYAPELTGIPPLVTDAADWLAERGHEVEVVTAMPNYPERRIHAGYRDHVAVSERRREVRVHRSWLRVRPGESFVDKIAYELSFGLASLLPAARRLRGADVVVCVVPSLVAALLGSALVRAARATGRAPRFVLWFQDLVLLAASSVGAGGRGQALLRAARPLERVAAGGADAVVVCSPGFRQYLANLGTEDGRIETIHNWVDTGWIKPVDGLRSAKATRFLYAGNLGYTQGFETLVEAAASSGPSVEIELVGGGNAAAHVRRLAASSPNVRVRPPVPRSELPALLASADAHLVLQRAVSAGANFPSKIASYLASGRPIIASIESNTPAAHVLRESGAALLVPPESPADLARAIRTLRDEPERREELGRRGREFAVAHFARERALPELERVLLGEERSA